MLFVVVVVPPNKGLFVVVDVFPNIDDVGCVDAAVWPKIEEVGFAPNKFALLNVKQYLKKNMIEE